MAGWKLTRFQDGIKHPITKSGGEAIGEDMKQLMKDMCDPPRAGKSRNGWAKKRLGQRYSAMFTRKGVMKDTSPLFRIHPHDLGLPPHIWQYVHTDEILKGQQHWDQPDFYKVDGEWRNRRASAVSPMHGKNGRSISNQVITPAGKEYLPRAKLSTPYSTKILDLSLQRAGDVRAADLNVQRIDKVIQHRINAAREAARV